MVCMTLSAHLSRLGWSNRELARRLGVAEATTRAWREPPAAVIEWLASIVVPDAPGMGARLPGAPPSGSASISATASPDQSPREPE